LALESQTGNRTKVTGITKPQWLPIGPTPDPNTAWKTLLRPMPREYRLLKAERMANPTSCRRCSGGGRQPQVSHRHRSLSRLCSLCSRPIAPSLDLTAECRTPFREPLQLIVMSVMSGTFPDTYGVFYVTFNSWRVRGPSRHRHGERHRRNALPKRLTRRRDGDDANDGELQEYSRQRVHLYFLGSLTPSP
jgi:hypothetical protein